MESSPFLGKFRHRRFADLLAHCTQPDRLLSPARILPKSRSLAPQSTGQDSGLTADNDVEASKGVLAP